MSITSRSRAHLHTFLIAALTIGLLWLVFHNVDVGELWRAITAADIRLIGAAVATTMVTYFLRALRWQAILAPIGHARLNTTFRATVIGFTATFLLPARVGEILRPYLVARREGFKATATFATVVVERLLDLSTVLLLFACSLPFLRVDVGRELKVAGAVAAVSAVGALALLFLFAGHPERLGRWAHRLSGWLPERLRGTAAHLVQAFAEGLAVLRSPGQMAVAGAWSLPVWLSIAFSIWLTSHAFGLTFSFVGSFLVLAFLAVGVSLPTPGGVGGFHGMYLMAVTTVFGADRDTGAAAAIVLHAVSFVPVSILGLFFMWQDGLTLGGLKSLRPVAEAADGPEGGRRG